MVAYIVIMRFSKKEEELNVIHHNNSISCCCSDDSLIDYDRIETKKYMKESEKMNKKRKEVLITTIIILVFLLQSCANKPVNESSVDDPDLDNIVESSDSEEPTEWRTVSFKEYIEESPRIIAVETSESSKPAHDNHPESFVFVKDNNAYNFRISRAYSIYSAEEIPFFTDEVYDSLELTYGDLTKEDTLRVLDEYINMFLVTISELDNETVRQEIAQIYSAYANHRDTVGWATDWDEDKLISINPDIVPYLRDLEKRFDDILSSTTYGSRIINNPISAEIKEFEDLAGHKLEDISLDDEETLKIKNNLDHIGSSVKLLPSEENESFREFFAHQGFVYREDATKSFLLRTDNSGNYVERESLSWTDETEDGFSGISVKYDGGYNHEIYDKAFYGSNYCFILTDGKTLIEFDEIGTEGMEVK